MLKKAFIGLIGMVVCFAAIKVSSAQEQKNINASPRKLAKQLADKAIILIQQGDSEALFSLMSSQSQQTGSAKQIHDTLSQLNIEYGRILNQEFKQGTEGKFFQLSRGIQDIYKLWYKTATDKNIGGLFTIIQVTFENGQPVLVSFQMITFAGGQVPLDLK